MGHSSGRQPRLDRHQSRVRPSVAANQDLVAGGRALEVVAEVVAELVGTDLDLRGSGAEGARTPGLCHAMAALFQLSYSPSELEICRKVNARALAVSRRDDPQVDRRAVADERARKKV